MALLKAVIGLVLLSIIFFAGYYFYENNLKGEVQKLSVADYDAETEIDIEEVSSEIVQFYKNMRFNHNKITYYMNTQCSADKFEDMKEAFKRINLGTNNIISFYQDTEEKADIVIGCSEDSYEKEKNIFIAGEGGPTRIINSSMPVIIRGKILLYNESLASCEDPLLEIHELMHVFGYDHINKKNDVMYPYLNCNQELSEELIEHIINLYSIEPFAELYFEKIAGYKERYLGKWYLNFNASINNDGIIDAENSFLKVYAKEKLVGSFNLEKINFGGGENFYVNNLLIPSDAEKIRLEIETITNEQNKKNNIIELEI